MIVHEAVRSGGFGAEIVATIAEHGLLDLVAPVKRITAPDTVVPLARMEELYMPQVDAIATGHQPLDLTVTRLSRLGDLPLSWAEQRRLLGFKP